MEGPQPLTPLSPGQDERHAPSGPILDVCVGFPETISEAECRPRWQEELGRAGREPGGASGRRGVELGSGRGPGRALGV